MFIIFWKKKKKSFFSFGGSSLRELHMFICFQQK